MWAKAIQQTGKLSSTAFIRIYLPPIERNMCFQLRILPSNLSMSQEQSFFVYLEGFKKYPKQVKPSSSARKPIPNSSFNSSFKESCAFECKKMDSVALSSKPETSQKEQRIKCMMDHSAKLAFVKISTSSAKRIWRIYVSPATFTPFKSPSACLFLSKMLRPSRIKMKRRGESEHPCQSPLSQ